MEEFEVSFLWDEEAAVWVATSERIPGLILESGSLDALMERVRYTVPELLALNGFVSDGLTLCFSSRRRELVIS